MAITVSDYVSAVDSPTGEGFSVSYSTAIGQTVTTDSTYMGDGDTHYWGVCWDKEKGEFVKGGGGYDLRGVIVDADDDLKALYFGLQDAKKALAKAQAALRKHQQDQYDADYRDGQPTVGKVVEVVKGRKVPQGIVAQVVWYGESTYGGHRVGLLIDGEKVYTSADNVEVVPAARLGLAA